MDQNFENLAEDLKGLLGEFEQSGLPIDEFLKKKLTEKGLDAGKELAEMNSTLQEIDESYQDLQNAKAEGKTRERWMKGKLDDIARESGVNAEDMGKILEVAENAMEGNESSEPQGNLPFEGADARKHLDRIVDGIKINVAMGYAENKQKENENE